MQTPEHMNRTVNVGLSATGADRKQGMTLDELGSLVTKAHRLGVPGDSPIFADVGWSQQVRQIHVRPEKRTQHPQETNR